MSFNTELLKYDYRKDVHSIINSLDNEDIIKRLSSLQEDQCELIEIQTFLTTSHTHKELVEYYCMIVWDWGWEGCDWFIKHPNQLR